MSTLALALFFMAWLICLFAAPAVVAWWITGCWPWE